MRSRVRISPLLFLCLILTGNFRIRSNTRASLTGKIQEFCTARQVIIPKAQHCFAKGIRKVESSAHAILFLLIVRKQNLHSRPVKLRLVSRLVCRANLSFGIFVYFSLHRCFYVKFML